MKTTPVLSTVIEVKSYASIKENYGLSGIKLDLNLAQCQKLKQIHTQIMDSLQNESDDLSINVLEIFHDLLPLLENFKSITTPNDKDLF